LPAAIPLGTFRDFPGSGGNSWKAAFMMLCREANTSNRARLLPGLAKNQTTLKKQALEPTT